MALTHASTKSQAATRASLARAASREPDPARDRLIAESARRFLSAPHPHSGAAAHQQALQLIAAYTAQLEAALTRISVNARFAHDSGADFDLAGCADLCDTALEGAAS